MGLNRDTLIYIVSMGNDGFVVVSADRRTTPVWGYSDNGRYNPPTMPPALLGLLDAYKRTVSDIRQGLIDPSEIEEVEDDKTCVLPLLTTYWGQRNGYNLFCPTNCPAGCVAVAMAQILKYWSCRIPGNYAWNNMPDGAATTSSARLIADCGDACEMDYSSGGSSSTITKARDGFVSDFDISSSADVKRRFWHLRKWKGMLKDELEAGRPILYRGSDFSLSGHAWVIDGYRDGKFHCNWGWSRESDGYYSLNHFYPKGNNYNEFEGAIFKVEPKKEVGVETPTLTAKSYNYSTAGYYLWVPEAFGATQYQWSTANGSITSSGKSVRLYTDISTKVKVRAYNERCDIYSDFCEATITINYGPISGPSQICTENVVYSVPNLPSGATVVWSKSVGIVYVSGQNTNSYKVRSGSPVCEGWIAATVTYKGIEYVLSRKKVQIGAPAPQLVGPFQDGNVMAQICACKEATMEVFPVLPQVSRYHWEMQASEPYTYILSNTSHADIAAEGVGWRTISCKQYIEQCGWSETVTKRVYAYDCGNCNNFTISPNPATATINIEPENFDPGKGRNNVAQINTVQIYSQSGLLQLSESINGLESVTISIDRLQRGIYIVFINGAEKHTLIKE